MRHQENSGIRSSEHSIWIWIILAGLLLFSSFIAVGALALINANQQTELPTGSQTVPSLSK